MIQDKNETFEERFKREFENAYCTRELAEKMGFSTRTCFRYLKKYNLGYPPGRPSRKLVPGKLYGGFAQWISKHPEIQLETTSPTEISNLTGLTVEQVKSSLYRMRRRHQERLHDIGDIRKLPGGFKKPNGNIYLFSDVTKYKMKTSPYSEYVELYLIMHNGEEVRVRASLQRLEKYAILKSELLHPRGIVRSSS